MTDFKAKMHQIRFRLGLRPRPRWGAYSAPQIPSWIWEPALRQGEGLGWGRGGKGEGEGGGSRGDGKEGPQVTVEPGPLRALLRHWSTQLMTQYIACTNWSSRVDDARRRSTAATATTLPFRRPPLWLAGGDSERACRV